ncbi:MAG: PAS domain S-box protein [Chloroflexi bacterium]|nr:PAS domain S-box protein [Chloroflexota bacterium]
MEGRGQDSAGIPDEGDNSSKAAKNESGNSPLSLRQFLQVLSTALQGLPERIAYLDPELKVLWANKVATETANLALEEMVGRHCHEVWHQRSNACADCPVQRAAQSGAFQEGEIEGTDGKIWLVWAEPIRNNIGEVIGFLELAHDITQQRKAAEKLRESEMKYTTLVEQGNDWVIVLQDGVIAFANTAVVKTTGFSMPEVLGQPFVNFIPPEWRDTITSRYMKRLAGEEVPNRYEMEILRKDGSRIPVEANANVIMYEGRPADMAVVRDITERKQFEATLQQKIRELTGLNNFFAKCLNQGFETADEYFRLASDIMKASQEILALAKEAQAMRINVEAPPNEKQQDTEQGTP